MPPNDPRRTSGESAHDAQAPKANWRGKGKSGGAAPRYRWQKDWTKKQEQEHGQKIFWHRVKIAAWSSLAAGLLAIVIAVAFFFPKQTPLIAVAVTDYGAPLPPNSWAAEDVERLKEVNNQYLAYSNISQDWTSEEAGLNKLRDRLATARPGGPRRDIIALYLSMHGVLDAAGEPCWLPLAGAVVLGLLLAWGAVVSAPPMPATPTKAYETPLDMCRPPFHSH